MTKESPEKAYDKNNPPIANERRAHPRVHLDLDDITVDGSHWSFVIDLSQNGIAFHSEVDFPKDSIVYITVEGMEKMGALVMESELESDEENAIAPHRISCKFETENAGMKLLERLQVAEDEILPELN